MTDELSTNPTETDEPTPIEVVVKNPKTNRDSNPYDDIESADYHDTLKITDKDIKEFEDANS